MSNYVDYNNATSLMNAIKTALDGAGGGSMQVIGLETLTSLNAGDIVVQSADYEFSGGANFINVDYVEITNSGNSVTNYGSAAPTLKSITPIVVPSNTVYVSKANNVIFEQMGEYYTAACNVSLMYDELQSAWSISLGQLSGGSRLVYGLGGPTIWYCPFSNLNSSGLHIAQLFKVLRVG